MLLVVFHNFPLVHLLSILLGEAIWLRILSTQSRGRTMYKPVLSPSHTMRIRVQRRRTNERIWWHVRETARDDRTMIRLFCSRCRAGTFSDCTTHLEKVKKYVLSPNSYGGHSTAMKRKRSQAAHFAAFPGQQWLQIVSIHCPFCCAAKATSHSWARFAAAAKPFCRRN